LVRVLESKGHLATPTLLTRSSFKHFQIRTTAVAPDFKILVHAFRMGETLPTTTWNSGNTELTVSFPSQTDTITFAPAASGKTDIVVNRGGSAIASVTTAGAALRRSGNGCLGTANLSASKPACRPTPIAELQPHLTLRLPRRLGVQPDAGS
jgi:hypothetical protein